MTKRKSRQNPKKTTTPKKTEPKEPEPKKITPKKPPRDGLKDLPPPPGK